MLRPRPLYCAIAPHHRDSALAEDVCDGRFSLLGTTVEVGWPVDWRAAGLPDDEEWRILWHKFPYGLDLAHAFRTTGERRFLDAWQDLALSFLDQVPFGTGIDSSDVIGRRIANWIFAWDLFAGAGDFPGLRPGAAERLLDGLSRQLEHLLADLTPARNHRTLELAAVFNAALAFPQLDPAGDRLAFAVAELDRNLHTDFLADGVHRERSTHYHMEVLRNFLAARENGRRYGVAFPAGFDGHLERACTFALHAHRPDGGLPAFSDADSGDFRDLLVLGADLFGREDLRFGATNGREGMPTAVCSASFPDGGYHVQRSAWEPPGKAFADACHLLFDCGPPGAGGHGHFDALHFEAAAGGRPLVVDPGRYTYSEAGPVNWRRWFKSTAAHNTVQVDGLDQTPYTKGSPRRGTEARTRLLLRASAPGLDLLAGEVRSVAYPAVHTRRIVFVAGEFWLIEDRVRGPQPHRAELRFHLTPDAWEAELIREGGLVRLTAPGYTLLATVPTSGTQVGQARLEPGWMAPSYGVKVPAPVVTLEAPEAPAADFLSLLAPAGVMERNGRPVRIARREEGGATLLEVEWQGAAGPLHDLVVLDDGQAAWVRRGPDGEVLDAAAAPVPQAGIHESTGRTDEENGAGVGSAGAGHRFDLGRGEPALVLLPGWGLDRHAWQRQIERFAPERRVIALDGLGESGAGDLSLADLVTEVGAAVRELGLTRPILCGHALGAAVALAYALERPADLAGLVLVSPPSPAPEARQRGRAAAERFAQAIELYGIEETVRPLRERLFSRAFRLSHSLEVAGWEARFVARPPDALLRTLHVLGRHQDRLPEPGELALPALLVAGAADPTCRPGELNGLAGRLPGSQVAVLESGHLPMLEQPAAFNERLAELLARL